MKTGYPDSSRTAATAADIKIILQHRKDVIVSWRRKLRNKLRPCWSDCLRELAAGKPWRWMHVNAADKNHSHVLEVWKRGRDTSMGSWNEEKFRIRNIQTFQILGLHSTAGSSSPKVASVAPHGPKLESWGTLGKPGRMRECFWILSKPLGLTKLKTYFAVWTCLDMSSTQKLSNCRESGLVECHTIYIYNLYITYICISGPILLCPI